MGLLLAFLGIPGCASPPSRIEDGEQVAAPWGYWDYCERYREDPICSFVKR